MRRWWLRSSWIRGDGAGSALRSSHQWRVVTMKNITPTADQPPAIPDKPKRISRRVRSAGVLAVLGCRVLNLAGSNPHAMDGVADYIGGALLAFRASGHQD
jgi:hypothetical protein